MRIEAQMRRAKPSHLGSASRSKNRAGEERKKTPPATETDADFPRVHVNGAHGQTSRRVRKRLQTLALALMVRH